MKVFNKLNLSLLILLLLPLMIACSEKEEPDPGAFSYKPVIYLYPQEITEVSVELDYKGELTTTYPVYQDGWIVTADPSGQLTSQTGQTYNYLYWEGINHFESDLSSGFVIPGDKTAQFLEEALEKLGLTRQEANEFIVYWLPQMEGNPYNLISFQNEAYTENVKLQVEPKPDTVIRVFMAWKPLDKPLDLPEQELTAPERQGFTVVEWGGTKVD